MREMQYGRVNNRTSDVWRGRTIEVLVTAHGFHKGIAQAIGWYDRPVREAIDEDNPFAGLASILRVPDQEVLERMQTKTERTKVVIYQNHHGVLPEVGERWSVELTGSTTTSMGLLLFGSATTIVAEAKGGHPLVLRLEDLGRSKEWCRVKTSLRDVRDESFDAVDTYEYQGRFVGVVMIRDDVGRPVVTFRLADVRRRALYYNESHLAESRMEWGDWRTIARTDVAFILDGLTGDCDRYYGHSTMNRQEWNLTVRFLDESDDGFFY